MLMIQYRKRERGGGGGRRIEFLAMVNSNISMVIIQSKLGGPCLRWYSRKQSSSRPL